MRPTEPPNPNRGAQPACSFATSIIKPHPRRGTSGDNPCYSSCSGVLANSDMQGGTYRSQHCELDQFFSKETLANIGIVAPSTSNPRNGWPTSDRSCKLATIISWDWLDSVARRLAQESNKPQENKKAKKKKKKALVVHTGNDERGVCKTKRPTKSHLLFLLVPIKSGARFHSFLQQRLTGDRHIKLQKQVRLQMMRCRQKLCSQCPIRSSAHNAHRAVCPIGLMQAGKPGLPSERASVSPSAHKVRTVCVGFYGRPPFEFATICNTEICIW